MDFNTIYETVAPYLGTTTIAGLIIFVITVAVKLKQLFQRSGVSLKNLETEVATAFKKALPDKLYIEVEALTKKELGAITEHIKEVVDEKFLAQIKANTELTQAIAKALLSQKAIPDSAKEEIAALLEVEPTDTTQALKVELIKTEEKEKKETKAYPVM